MFVARDASGGARLVVNEIGAARPQFRPLDDRRRADLAIRAAYPRHRRLAARQPGAAGAIEMSNLIGDEVDEWRDILAQPGLRCTSTASWNPPGPQDGPCDAGVRRAAARRLSVAGTPAARLWLDREADSAIGAV